MEALLIIFAEFIAGLLAPLAALAATVVTLVVIFVGELVGLLMHVMFRLIGRRRAQQTPVEKSPRKQSSATTALTAPVVQPLGRPIAATATTAALVHTPVRPWRRRVLLAGGVLTTLAVVLLVVIECGVDRSIVRSALARLAAKGGPQITAETLEVTTCTGRIAMGGLHVVMAGRTTADLTAQEAVINANLWSLLFGEAHLTAVSVRGVRGNLSHELGTPKPTSGFRIGSNIVTVTDNGVTVEAAPRRHFCIDELRIDDAAVEVDLHASARKIAGPLTIMQLTTTELGSRRLLSAVLLRTTASGTWLGATVAAATGEIADGRATRWTITGMPAAALGLQLGRPWDAFDGGSIDVAITDRWRLGDERMIDLDWRLTGRDLRIATRPDHDRFAATVTVALKAMVELQQGALDLHGTARIDRDTFAVAVSKDLSGLGVVMTDALLERVMPDPAKREILRQLAGDVGRALLDKWRQRPRP